MTAKEKMERLLVVDGNSLIHRGFHAIPHLSTKGGEPTNGVYGFALLFFKALKELKPQYVAVTFDLPTPTFREKIYEPYKENRIAAPAELYQQIPRVKELISAFNLPVYEKEGYEADDLIGSLARLSKKEANLETVILTGDLDTLQLVNDRIKVYAPKQGLSETKLYDEKAVKERYGLKPSQLVDFKALRGDPSDNIPGVKGIGEKTAVELLQRFGTLEKIYEYLDGLRLRSGSKADLIKPRVALLLQEHRKDAAISKKLAEIIKDLKIELDLEKARLDQYDQGKVFKLFQELEFRSLLDKLPKPVIPTLTSPIGEEKNSLSLVGGGKGKGVKYELINAPGKYQRFLGELKKQKEFALDTETTSMKPLQARLLGIGFSWKEGEAYYLPAKILGPELKKILADQNTLKIGHNIKYDYLVLKRSNLELGGKFFDTMIAAYLLNPGARNFDLDTLSFVEFGFRKTTIASLIGEGKKEINMAEVPQEKVAAYCCEDADYTRRLKNKLSPELKRMKLEKVFFGIEMPLIRVLSGMEYWGVRIEPRVLQKSSREAGADIEKLEKRIWRLSGEEFNIGSPIQLKQILFEKLGIPSQELKKGKTGLSTAATELEKLRGLHPIVDLIFDWRELSKLKNTYLDTLPELLDPSTNRLHTSYNQTITATGRLSSSDPNLQNIPIRTELGRKIRCAFVAEKKYKLVAVDYSQIELRLAAHLSGDPKMIKVFQEGGDIHTTTAKEIFGLKNESEVTVEQRRDAKTINFGILYGLRAYGLKSRIPGISQGEAQDFIDKYFASYPELTAYLGKVMAETRKEGYVKNEVGRIRFLPEINSSQFQVRSAAERAAINMPLQSLAADIIKMAMNHLAEEGLADRADCRMLLQVHDELVFEVAEDKLGQFVPRIEKIMSEIYKLKVPLAVEAKVGENWGEMDPINF